MKNQDRSKLRSDHLTRRNYIKRDPILLKNVESSPERPNLKPVPGYLSSYKSKYEQQGGIAKGQFSKNGKTSFKFGEYDY